ncbi:MAG: hypothetical protein KIH69_014475 [Anaerolineae bacterium]|nr:hypothetical protein [Anaerolineae bacterium]
MKTTFFRPLFNAYATQNRPLNPNYFQKMMRFVPSELVSLYVMVQAIASNVGIWAQWALLIGVLLFTPIWVYRSTYTPDAPVPLFQIVAATFIMGGCEILLSGALIPLTQHHWMVLGLLFFGGVVLLPVIEQEVCNEASFNDASQT